MAKSARPSLLFSQMKTPDGSYGCQRALLKTSHMRTLHLEKEGKGGGIMGTKLSDTLRPGCCSGYCLIYGEKKTNSFIFITADVNTNCVALTMEVGGVK